MSTRRTLIVDDTPDLRELLALTLDDDEAFEVVAEASDGREAIDVAQAERPDLVVLDLAMPVMDGLEALPHLRRTVPAATIVVLSGFGATAMRDQALVSGADGYVEKGTRLPAIVDRLRRIADESESRRGLTTGAPRSPRGDGHAPEPHAATRTTGADDVDDLGALLVEQAPVAMLVAEPADGTVLFANGAASQLLGIVAGPLSSLADLLPEVWEQLGPGPAGPVPHVAEDTVRVRLERDGARIAVQVGRAGRRLVLYGQPDPADDELTRLRGAMTSTAQELRTPVAVLTGAAEMLRPDAASLAPERRSALLASVGRQAGQLDALTEDLLTADQARRGVLDLHREVVELGEAMEVVLAPHPDVALHVLGRDGDSSAPLRVRVDVSRLGQMVGNLVANARTFGAAPVVVTISGRGPWVRLEVEDQGPGVAESFRDQLFEEFTRGPGVSSRGTGLGLFVVRRLALAHGGDVAHRNGADRGSVFTLSLPAVPAD